MKIRTILVEDEKPAMERMRSLLKDSHDIDIVGEAEDGISAVKIISELKPDLIFLDIRLPELSGFQVLQKITHHPKVVFVTAYDKYALKAFEENAVDYLLKPTSVERVRQAVSKVLQAQHSIDQELIRLLKDKIESNRYTERFTVKLKDEILLIPSDSVYWFHASDKYVFLKTYDNDYFLDYTLKKLEETLDPEKFLRIHKSVIVSAKRIIKIKRGITGSYSLIMSDSRNSQLDIGRSYLPLLKEKFNF